MPMISQGPRADRVVHGPVCQRLTIDTHYPSAAER